MNQIRAKGARTHQGTSVVFGVLDAAHVLESRLEGALGKVGLSMAKVGVLDTLTKAPEPLTLGELAEKISCVRSNVTQLVDRLEAEGLVRRISDPNDRRIRRAALTPTGRAACAEGMRILVLEEQVVMSALGQEDAPALLKVLRRLTP
jgi:DNA-binding MarR family transcriptional regulator